MTTIVENVAYALCVLEERLRNRELDRFYMEVERKWRRFIPEATSLIDELFRLGLTITPVQKMDSEAEGK